MLSRTAACLAVFALAALSVGASGAGAAGDPCRIAPSGLPPAPAGAKNPCVRIRDVRLRGRRVSFEIRLRPEAEGRVWAVAWQPRWGQYLGMREERPGVYRAYGTLKQNGLWRLIVHYKPFDNREWAPVIAHARLFVP